jgi:hypothetical protein
VGLERGPLSLVSTTKELLDRKVADRISDFISNSVAELYRPSDRSLSVPTFADRRCHVVSVTDLYGRILGFPDRFILLLTPWPESSSDYTD